MPKLSADLATAQGLSVFPKDIYPAHIDKVESKLSKGSGAQMLSVRWKPEGEKAGDNPGMIFDNVMVSGRSNAGDPVRTDRLCDYINALGIEWDCSACGATSTKRFVVQNGKYFCPACGKTAVFTFDPDLFQGKRALIQVDIEKGQNDEDRNTEKRVRPLE